MTSSERSGLAVDPLEWLSDALRPDDERDAATAVRIPGSTALDAQEQTGLGAGMGGADPAWAFTGVPQAEAAQEAVGQICQRHCPINTRCVEEACRFFRLEQAAQDYLDYGPSGVDFGEEGEGWIVEGI